MRTNKKVSWGLKVSLAVLGIMLCLCINNNVSRHRLKNGSIFRDSAHPLSIKMSASWFEETGVPGENSIKHLQSELPSRLFLPDPFQLFHVAVAPKRLPINNEFFSEHSLSLSVMISASWRLDLRQATERGGVRKLGSQCAAANARLMRGGVGARLMSLLALWEDRAMTLA